MPPATPTERATSRATRGAPTASTASSTAARRTRTSTSFTAACARTLARRPWGRPPATTASAAFPPAPIRTASATATTRPSARRMSRTTPKTAERATCACLYPNGTGACVNRVCMLDGCNEGFADCNAAPGCETRLATEDNCRTCGETCRNDHGATDCTATGCQPTCQIGWGDCDGNKNNGCETELNSLTNCGQCGRACSTPHGRPSCATGTCEVTSCDAGWDDCDDAARQRLRAAAQHAHELRRLQRRLQPAARERGVRHGRGHVELHLCAHDVRLRL